MSRRPEKFQDAFFYQLQIAHCQLLIANCPLHLTFAPVKENEKYEVVIGLEVHTQLLTQSKLFCGDSAAFSTNPNTHISPITLAHPGTLPKMNVKAIEYAIKLGLALHCEIEQHNYFARNIQLPFAKMDLCQ
jgi:hypothetical protein